jgi:hypothetical protein
MRNVATPVLLVTYCIPLAVDPNTGSVKVKLVTFWRPGIDLWHCCTGFLSSAPCAELLSWNTATFLRYDSLSSKFSALKKSVESRSVFVRNLDLYKCLVSVETYRCRKEMMVENVYTDRFLFYSVSFWTLAESDGSMDVCIQDVNILRLNRKYGRSTVKSKAILVTGRGGL